MNTEIYLIDYIKSRYRQAKWEIPIKYHPVINQTLQTEHSPQPFLQFSESNRASQSPLSAAVYKHADLIVRNISSITLIIRHILSLVSIQRLSGATASYLSTV
jgi:hypothetical protein